jgi:glutathione peroxidase
MYMKKILLFGLLLFSTFSLSAQQNIYGFKMKDITGQTVKLDTYKGKVVLIVNTASKCGLTPQYEGLESLYQKYKDQGLVILGFPCNQFMGQEPGTSEEILTFCTNKYNVTFPLFEKIEVNGDKTHPLYQFLKGKLPLEGKNDIRWNFEKFLIDRNGNPVKRFAPKMKPSEIEEEIVSLLNTK